MPDTVLPPIVLTDTLSRGVEQEIMEYFRDVLYGPLLDLLQTEELPVKTNAKTTAIERGLREKRIWFADGVFSGKFDAAISRELRAMGAAKHSRTGTFRLPSAKLPIDLRQAVALAQERSKKVCVEILNTLKQMQANAAKAQTGINLDKPVADIIDNLGRQWNRTTGGKGIAVSPDFSHGVREAVTADYRHSVDKSIKNFEEQRIPILRKRVEEVIFKGARTDKLAKVIEAEFGVSKRKAAWLAEQETSILVAKYRESRYKSAGSKRYVWSTSHDSRVRHDHDDLNDKIFAWDQPPITNKATGARNNPGSDFGCRCVARALLPMQEAAYGNTLNTQKT
jgi:SPP1 gp7 family putative phage head morphogenesis protein